MTSTETPQANVMSDTDSAREASRKQSNAAASFLIAEIAALIFLLAGTGFLYLSIFEPVLLICGILYFGSAMFLFISRREVASLLVAFLGLLGLFAFVAFVLYSLSLMQFRR